MKPRSLFIVSSDPRTSGLPAEAIRIAAGVGAWKRVEVLLYLRDAAVLAIGEFVDALVDEDHFERYLPILGEWGRPVYVQGQNPLLNELGSPSLPLEPISDRQLAALAASANHVLHF
jgi:hypothetical protein